MGIQHPQQFGTPEYERKLGEGLRNKVIDVQLPTLVYSFTLLAEHVIIFV